LGVVEDPWSEAEGRVVANVLGVQARQLSDPFARIVLVEPQNRSLHGASVPLALLMTC